MTVIYRPSLFGGSLAGGIFLLFLIIGLWSAVYEWFFFWLLILCVFGGDYYYVIPRKVETSKGEAETSKGEAETDELLKETKLSF